MGGNTIICREPTALNVFDHIFSDGINSIPTIQIEPTALNPVENDALITESHRNNWQYPMILLHTDISRTKTLTLNSKLVKEHKNRIVLCYYNQIKRLTLAALKLIKESDYLAVF